MISTWWPWSAARVSNRDLELAALENLTPLPFASEYIPQLDADLDQIQVWIDAKRKWMENVADRRVRRAYRGWIDFLQTEVNANRKENRTHGEQKAFEKRWRKYVDEYDRGRQVAKVISRP